MISIKKKILWAVVAIPLLLMSMVGTGCSKNLATGESMFNLIDEPKEIALGLEAEPTFIKDNGGEVDSPVVRTYVTNLGFQLAMVGERPGLPWSFHVLDTAVINAFALPGGKVFITRGLLDHLTNEAQLAGVLGHECGHVTAQHIGQEMSRAEVVQGAVTGLNAASDYTKKNDKDSTGTGITNSQWLTYLGVGVQKGGALYLLKFSRDEESQADALGIRYMTRLGYSPYGQLQVMQILKEVSGSSSSSEMMSTHPLPETRIERVNQIIAKDFPTAKDSPAFKFNEEEYRKNVTEPLSHLPPPRHA